MIIYYNLRHRRVVYLMALYIVNKKKPHGSIRCTNSVIIKCNIHLYCLLHGIFLIFSQKYALNISAVVAWRSFASKFFLTHDKTSSVRVRKYDRHVHTKTNRKIFAYLLFYLFLSDARMISKCAK